MKNIFKIFLASLSLFIFLGFFSFVDAKSVKVKSYFKPSTGRYVQPYYRSTPNKTKFDNWSTKGNYNPYTGKKGTVNPYKFKY
jgi:hypothetical protein